MGAKAIESSLRNNEIDMNLKLVSISNNAVWTYKRARYISNDIDWNFQGH